MYEYSSGEMIIMAVGVIFGVIGFYCLWMAAKIDSENVERRWK